MKTIVLLSGGVDSAVALAHAVDRGVEVGMALSFNYGQTHLREVWAAQAVANHYNVEHHILDIRNALDAPSALTYHGGIPESPASTPDSTLVPGRNLVLVSVATSWASAWGYGAVVIGANADDRAGYPDCRPGFLELLDATTREGYGVSVWAPLLKMTKKEIVELGTKLDVPFDLTWSCYRGGATPCHRCGACVLREGAGL